jgi:hypothetical protein
VVGRRNERGPLVMHAPSSPLPVSSGRPVPDGLRTVPGGGDLWRRAAIALLERIHFRRRLQLGRHAYATLSGRGLSLSLRSRRDSAFLPSGPEASAASNPGSS